MLGFFPTLQVRPGILFTAEVAAMALICASLAFYSCSAAGDSDTEGEVGGAAAAFRRAFITVSGMVERPVGDQKLGGGGYLLAITDRRTDVCRHRQLT